MATVKQQRIVVLARKSRHGRTCAPLARGEGVQVLWETVPSTGTCTGMVRASRFTEVKGGRAQVSVSE